MREYKAGDRVRVVASSFGHAIALNDVVVIEGIRNEHSYDVRSIKTGMTQFVRKSNVRSFRTKPHKYDLQLSKAAIVRVTKKGLKVDDGLVAWQDYDLLMEGHRIKTPAGLAVGDRDGIAVGCQKIRKDKLAEIDKLRKEVGA